MPRRPTRSALRSVAATLAVVVTALGSALLGAGPAAAAPVELTGLALTVNSTGTGYGTGTQCWLQPAGSGPSDGTVCSNDTMEFGWAFTAPATAAPDPVVLRQTLPAGWTWSSTTALACAGSAALGFTGVSAVSGDGRTLTCTVTITPNTGVIAQLAMTATPGSSAVPNTPYAGELAVDNGTGAVVLPADRAVTVLSAPNADAFLGTPNGANTGYATIDGTEYYYGGYVLAVTGRDTKGNQTLVVPYSFATDLSTFPAGTTVTITRCPFGVTCTWNPGTQRIEFISASTDGYIQSPIGANVAFTVYVPSAAGPVTLTQSIVDFAPVGIFDDTPNTEPSLTNNSVTRQFLGPQTDVPIPPGGRAITMLGCPAGTNVTAFNGPCEVNSTFAASNLIRVEPGDAVWTKVAVYNGRLTGGTIVPITDPLVCDYWDPAVYSLDTTRAVEVSRYDGSPYAATDYVLEYSDATWPDPQNVGGQGGTQCTDNPASWSADPASLGGPVTAVRARYVGTGGVLGTATDPAISAFQLTIPQRMGDVARGQWFNVGKIDFAENPTVPAITVVPFARVGGYEFTLAQSSVPATAMSSGDAATFTITPDIRPLTNPDAPVVGLEIRVTVDSCLGVPAFSAETLAAWAVAVADEGSPGADGIACTRDAGESPRVYVLTPIGPVTASSDLVPVTYAATSTINAPPDVNVVSGAAISSDVVPAVVANRTVQVLQVRASTLQKTASAAAVLSGGSLAWTATVVNQLPTPLGRTQVVDVLPRAGDAAGNGASAFLVGPVELYGNLIGSIVEYTTDPAPSPDPQSPATSWSPTAPGDWAAVTGVRLTIASYGANFLGTVRLTTTVDDAVAGAAVTNRVTGTAALDTPTPVALPTGSATVQALTFSAGDIAWNDVDGDGVYTAGIDVPVPDGTTVRLLPAAGGAPVATTTTTGGLYLFDGLDAGEYVIEIPATEFAAGGHLAGWTVSEAPPAGTTEEEIDLNDDLAHDAHPGPGGSVVSPPFTLSAETLADGTVVGDEPLGDDIHGLADSTRDDLSNLSVDLALVPTASLDLRAVVVDPTIAGAARPDSYDVLVTCVPPVGGEETRTVTLPADGSVRSVEGLTEGSECSVSGPIAAAAVGPVMTVSPPTVTVEADEPALMTVMFTYAAGSLVVEKEIAGVGAGLVADRSFRFAVDCTLDGVPIFDGDVAATVDPGAGTGTADPVAALPLGADCAVTEDGTGGADAAPAPVAVVIADEDPTLVRVTNAYSAATVNVALVTDGPRASEPAIAAQEYTVTATCVQPAAAGGTPRVLYDGTVTLRAGERTSLATADGPLLVPTGTRCFVPDTTAPILGTARANASSPQDAVALAPGDATALQEVDLLVTVTFPASPTPGTPPPTLGLLAHTGVLGAVAGVAVVALGLLVAGAVLRRRSLRSVD